jgi:site-specific recombinase XerD
MSDAPPESPPSPPDTALAIRPATTDIDSPSERASALVAWGGERAAARTFEFLTAAIQNPNTRRAYHHATGRFMRWCLDRNIALGQVTGPIIAAYIEELGRTLAPLSVKQHLAAIKHWGDYLVTGHVLETNPAQSVRGPRYSQTTGKTPVLEREQARALLDSIDATTVVGARDKALIAVMLFSFARVGAVVKMKARDYRGAGTASASLSLHEKGGKFHRVPAHHMAAAHLDVYVALAAFADTPNVPLWQSAPRHGGRLSGQPLSERAALDIVKRRCAAAGLPADICNHSFRATGITLHQDAGGDLEAARQIAGHSSIKTTQLYNRSGDKKRRAEVERVQL